MNKAHWAKVLKQCGGNIDKVMPCTVEGKVSGTFITRPMKAKTLDKLLKLKLALGYK